jgi:hypothetical protein
MSKTYYYYIPHNKAHLKLLKFVHNSNQSEAYHYYAGGWDEFYEWSFTSLFLNNFKPFIIPEEDVKYMKIK